MDEMINNETIKNVEQVANDIKNTAKIITLLYQDKTTNEFFVYLIQVDENNKPITYLGIPALVMSNFMKKNEHIFNKNQKDMMVA